MEDGLRAKYVRKHRYIFLLSQANPSLLTSGPSNTKSTSQSVLVSVQRVSSRSVPTDTHATPTTADHVLLSQPHTKHEDMLSMSPEHRDVANGAKVVFDNDGEGTSRD